MISDIGINSSAFHCMKHHLEITGKHEEGGLLCDNSYAIMHSWLKGTIAKSETTFMTAVHTMRKTFMFTVVEGSAFCLEL